MNDIEWNELMREVDNYKPEYYQAMNSYDRRTTYHKNANHHDKVNA